MNRPLRLILAGVCGIAVTLLVNAGGIWWLRGSDFATNAFYDGSALFLTLAIPALLGGLLLGWIAREAALNTAAITFALFCVVGFLHPFWRIPPVTVESAHSGLLHYFLYIPLTALAFGALGAWLAGQFAVGRWTVSDREPVAPSQLED
jgi:hypothetical protein